MPNASHGDAALQEEGVDGVTGDTKRGTERQASELNRAAVAEQDQLTQREK